MIRSLPCRYKLNLFSPLKYLAALIIALLLFTSGFAQTNYYLKAGGTVNSTASWGPNTDGSGTAPTNFTTANRIFNVCNNAAISLTGTWTVSGTSSKVVVGDGTNACNFSTAGFTLTVANGVDVSNAGTLTITNATSPVIGTCNAGSTVAYTGSLAQAVYAATFGNLTLGGSGTKTASGNFTVNSVLTVNSGITLALVGNRLLGLGTESGTGVITTTSTSTTLLPAGETWTGEVQYNGAAQTVVGGTYSGGLTIAGTGTSTASGAISLGGTGALKVSSTLAMSTFVLSNLGSNSGTGILTTACTTATSSTPIPSGLTWTLEVDYVATTAQTVMDGTYNGDLNIAGSGTSTAAGNVIMGNGTTLTVSSTFDLSSNTLSAAGTLTIAGTGILKTANTSSTPIPTGKTWTFEVDYTGANQTVVVGTYNGDLNIGGTGTQTAAGTIAMGSGALTISGILDLGTNTLTGTLTTTAGSGTLKTSSTTAALPTNKTWVFGVEYSASANQTIAVATSYGALTLSGSGTKTITAAQQVTGLLTVASGVTFNTSTFALTGAALTTAGSGLLTTANTSATPIPTGRTWSFQVQYNGATQTVMAGTYNGDLILNTGTKTAGGAIAMGTTGNLTVNGTLAMGTNQLTGTLSTPSGTGLLTTTSTNAAPIPSGVSWPFEVDFTNTTTAQTVPGGTYNGDLLVSGSTKSASGNIAAANFTVNSTLAMGTNLLTSVTGLAGTGILSTTNTSSTPIPSGLTWPFEIDYSGASQTVVAGTYNGDLNVGGTGTSTAAGNIVMGTGTTFTVGSTLDLTTNTLSAAGTLTIAGTGILKTANTSSTPLPTGKTWTFEVDYNGAAQTVMAGTYNGDLNIGGTGTSTASGAITLGTGTTLTVSSIFDMGTNALATGATFTSAGTGTLKTANTGTPITTGKTWTFAIEYNGVTQNVVAGTYNGGLIISGTGTKSAAGTVALGAANLNISSTLSMGTNQLTGATMTTSGTGLLQTAYTTTTAPIPSGRTYSFNVEYKQASAQNLVTATYSGNVTLSASATITMAGSTTIGGNFTLNFSSGTNSFVLNSATSNTLTVNGSFIGTKGLFDMNSGNSGTSTMIVKGNFTNTGATFNTTGTVANGIISFAGSGTVASPQTFSNTTDTNIDFVNYQVQLGTVLQLNSNMSLEISTNTIYQGALSVWGTLNMLSYAIAPIDLSSTGNAGQLYAMTLASGATIMTANATGLTGAFPTTCGTVTSCLSSSFNSVANYEFDGTGTTGTFTTTPTALTVNNLTVNSSGSVTASQNFAVTNALALTGTLNMGTNTISGIASNTGTGTLETQALSTAIPTAKTWNVGILYDASSGTQNVVAATSYTNLSFANGATKTFPTGTFNVTGNWSSATSGKIDLTTNTVTLNFSGSSAQALSDGGSDGGNGVFFKTVNFSGGGTKTMSGAGKFSVATTGTLTMSGSTQLAAGGVLWLKSDISSTAIVAAITSGNSITGDVYAERFMYGNNSNARRSYRLMSSITHDAATTTYNVFNMKQNMYITGAGGLGNAQNANDASSFDGGSNGAVIYHYYEPAAGVQSTSDFKPIGLPLTTDEFNVGEGMYVFYRGARTTTDGSGTSRFLTTVKPENTTQVFKGTLNQGSYTLPLSYTNSSNTQSDGYNLMGNPYPSTIDVMSSNITYGTSVTNFVYELDPTTKAYCAINRVSGVPTGNASRYIAAGEGFFVQATATGQSITFNEAAKVTNQLTAGSSLLMSVGGVPVASAPQLLRLKMINPADSTAADDVAILFDSAGKDTFDKTEDGYDFGGNGTTFLSSFSSDNVKLAINMMTAITKNTKIKLSVNSTLSGTFNLVATNLSSLDPRFEPRLVDNYKTDTVSLVKANTYSFTVDRTIAATYDDSRFQVIFVEKAPLVNSLLTFTANQVRSHIDVNWQTGTDIVNVTFAVEKSLDNKTFTSLTSFASDTRTAYSFTDSQPVVGDNYYRIKQTDAFGQVTYSAVVDVKYAAPTATDSNDKPFRIYPQPVVSTLNVALYQSYKGSIKLRVLDISGHEMQKTTFTGISTSLDVSRLRIGSYVVELTNGDDVIGRSIFIKL